MTKTITVIHEGKQLCTVEVNIDELGTIKLLSISLEAITYDIVYRVGATYANTIPRLEQKIEIVNFDSVH